MIRGIIFDMDGTILILPINYERLRSRLRALFGTQDSFNPIFTTVARLTEGNKELYRRSLAIIDEEELNAVGKLTIVEEAQDVLQRLKERYPLVLVTLQGKTPAYRCLNAAGLNPLFQTVFTREDSLDRFNQIQLAVSIMKIHPRNVLVVGDRLNDVICANKVGCKAVLIRKDSYNEIGEQAISIDRLSKIDFALDHFNKSDES